MKRFKKLPPELKRLVWTETRNAGAGWDRRRAPGVADAEDIERIQRHYERTNDYR